MAKGSREMGESSKTRERGESSNTKTDNPGITNRPPIDTTSHDEDTQPRQTKQNPAGNNEDVLPGHAALLRSFQLPKGTFWGMAAGKDGLLFTGSQSTDIELWHQGKAAGGFCAQKALNYHLLFDSTGSGCLYVGSYDGTVRVFQVGPDEGSLKFIRLEDLPSLQNQMKKKIWNEKTAILEWSKCMKWQGYPVASMTFSEVSGDTPTFLYTGSTDCSIKVWSLKDSLIVDCLKKHDMVVGAVAAGCDGRMFSGSQDGSVVSWLRNQTGTGTNDVSHTVVDTLLSGPVSVYALLLKSTTTGFATEAGHSELYAGLADGRVLVWKEGFNFSNSDMETLHGHNAVVTRVAGSPGHLVFSGSRDGKICGWSSKNGTKEHTLMMVLNAHEGQVNCIAAQEDWERNNKKGIWSCILYSGSEDKTLKTWHIETSVNDV